ncbi:hypothetical protein AXF42_Ash012638 [Apostasia shenzhenica]|uniref:Uncharacterized protein n=1 Tax=Apostasia shenzhenica TaxID=1088818 RepID=A0A2H9ZT86_9ASPA|nr:hypothetical protein AXF42_Ash012638 [Apostasia shenzhenica]
MNLLKRESGTFGFDQIFLQNFVSGLTFACNLADHQLRVVEDLDIFDSKVVAITGVSNESLIFDLVAHGGQVKPNYLMELDSFWAGEEGTNPSGRFT